jgi:hypothetical protein
MRPETFVKRTFNDARASALKVLAQEAKAMLPRGWKVILAVGWGFTVYDEDGERLVDCDTSCLPRNLPAGTRPFINAAALFFDIFGPGNEVFTSKGLKRK